MKITFQLLMTGSLLVCIVCSTKTTPASQRSKTTLRTIERTDAALCIINGAYYYRQQLFSGVIQEREPAGNLHRASNFFEGKEEGRSLQYYQNGQIAGQRYYHHGEKDSVHTGWWQNGKPRFEYHFSKGLYDGDYREWYKTGQPYKHIHYAGGNDTWGQGWRENGRLFMNYVVKNGRRYGMMNANLCYTVKNEQDSLANNTALLFNIGN